MQTGVVSLCLCNGLPGYSSQLHSRLREQCKGVESSLRANQVRVKVGTSRLLSPEIPGEGIKSFNFNLTRRQRRTHLDCHAQYRLRPGPILTKMQATQSRLQPCQNEEIESSCPEVEDSCNAILSGQRGVDRKSENTAEKPSGNEKSCDCMETAGQKRHAERRKVTPRPRVPRIEECSGGLLLALGVGLAAVATGGLIGAKPAIAAQVASATTSRGTGSSSKDGSPTISMQEVIRRGKEREEKREIVRRAEEEKLRKQRGDSVELSVLPELLETEAHQAVWQSLLAVQQENRAQLLAEMGMAEAYEADVKSKEAALAEKRATDSRAREALKKVEGDKVTRKQVKDLEREVSVAERAAAEAEKDLQEARERLVRLSNLKEEFHEKESRLLALWSEWKKEHIRRVTTDMRDEREEFRIKEDLEDAKEQQKLRAAALQLAGGTKVLNEKAGVSLKGPPKEPPQIVFSSEEEVQHGLRPFRVVKVNEAARVEELRKTVLGWKKWQLQQRQKAKEEIRNNPELAKQVAEAHKREVLETRDRVMTCTWYNEGTKQWEMSPYGATHAVLKDLVAQARIRHDAGAMYLQMKGSSREYFVDLRTYDYLFRDAGGFQMLYVRMQLTGVPTSVEVMWIPFRDWPVRKLVTLPIRVVASLANDVYDLAIPAKAKVWYYDVLVGVIEETWLRLGEPFMPRPVKVLLGYEHPNTPEGQRSTELGELTPAMIWLQDARKRNLEVRYENAPWWWVYLPARGAIVGYPLYILLWPLLKYIASLLSPGPLPEDAVDYKERLGAELEKKLDQDPEYKRTTMADTDPVKNALKRAKRIRKPEVTLKDMAGIDSIKEEVREVITFLKNPGKFKAVGARAPRGVLIVGPAGTGKSTLARAIAAEARVPVIEFQGMELEGGDWVGQAAANIRDLFKTARTMAPVIIFFDDFDNFVGVRSKDGKKAEQEHESLINQLLVELDGFETQEGVVLMATASRPWNIDPAIRRPGRMDRTLTLPVPNLAEREQILLSISRRYIDPSLSRLIDWSLVAEKAAGLTPFQLKEVPALIRASCIVGKDGDRDELAYLSWIVTRLNKILPEFIHKSEAYRRLNERFVSWMGLTITDDDVRRAVKALDLTGGMVQVFELEAPDMNTSPKFKFPHAVWAAGRALIAALLPSFDSVDAVWLDTTSWDGIGFVRLTPRPEGGFQEAEAVTRGYVEKQLVLCFGSYLASRLLTPLGDGNNSLDMPDFTKATEIASEMVLEYGWGPDDSPLIYQVPGYGGLELGERATEERNARIEAVYNAALERANHMIEQNRASLDALVEALMRYEFVSAEDLAVLLAKHGAIFEEEPFRLFPYSPPEVTSSTTSTAAPQNNNPALVGAPR